MRVITYNLHKGVGQGRTSSLEEVAHGIAELAPDLLLLQEVYHGVADIVKQSHFITDVVGYPHVFGPNAFYRRGCHGNATFASLPVSRSANIDATESFFERRGILHTVLESAAGPIDVLNLHFSLTGRQRRRQWRKLCEAMPADPLMPAVVCGDFNDWSNTLDRRARQTGILKNALWSAPRRNRSTFPARRPVLSIDRIYFRGFDLVDARVLTGDPWPRLSDHLPVLADLEPLGT